MLWVRSPTIDWLHSWRIWCITASPITMFKWRHITNLHMRYTVSQHHANLNQEAVHAETHLRCLLVCCLSFWAAHTNVCMAFYVLYCTWTSVERRDKNIHIQTYTHKRAFLTPLLPEGFLKGRINTNTLLKHIALKWVLQGEKCTHTSTHCFTHHYLCLSECLKGGMEMHHTLGKQQTGSIKSKSLQRKVSQGTFGKSFCPQSCSKSCYDTEVSYPPPAHIKFSAAHLVISTHFLSI